MKLRLFLGFFLFVFIGIALFVLDARKPARTNDSSPVTAAEASSPVAAAKLGSSTPAPTPGVSASGLAAGTAAPPLQPFTLGRPGANPAPARSNDRIPNAPEPLAVGADFLERMVSADGGSVNFALPGGQYARGKVDLIQRDEHGVATVQGRLDSPQPGTFFFHRESEPGVAGAFFGNARFDSGLVAYRLEPIGPDGSTMLVPRHIDDVICVGMPPAPPAADSPDAGGTPPIAAAEALGDPQNAPQTHPTNIPISPSQNGIIPLQSLPGATAVIFLDFEGGPGPWVGWNPSNFVAAPANVTTAQIKEVWQRVAEDYLPFNINVTTDRSVFEAAPRNSRQRVMITPTNTVAPTAGGVALGGSFDSSSDAVCWAFYTTGKNGAEVIAHEVGHTVDLAHDGRQRPDQDREEYYGGHGSGDTGWAPIMGVGYYQTLSQWSKGEYAYPTNTQDDLAIITNNNNNVDYRVDDYGDTLATAGYLEIQANNTVSNEGIIERNTDVDAFRFQSTGGSVSLTVSRVASGPNLDAEASIYDSANNLITSANPADSLAATVSANLPAGEYTLRVRGVGKGDATTGYTNYASLGTYLITGNVQGGVKPDRFSIPENSANGAAVGTVSPRNDHGGQPLGYAIASGNANGAFAIDAATGALTVANASVLNYETLSTRWDVPATIPLFVSITDSANPSLNESIRVVVTVTDVNETPTITGGAQTIFSRTRVGTKLMSVQGSDPDRFDFPTFSIVAGNAGGLFAIDPATGQLSVAGAINVSSTTVYPLTVRATDQLSPAKTADATVTITVRPLAAQYTPGAITVSYYENISGNGLSNLTNSAKFPDNPDSLETKTDLLEILNRGNNYGSVFRGYLLFPNAGNYTFRLSADDSAVLYISTTTNPADNLQRGSGISSATGYRQYGSSANINNLGAGTIRYIEVRHKEGGGDDHVTVAWEGPGIPLQPISGAYLVPFEKNFTPKVPAATLSVRENAFAGTVIGTANATDLNAGDVLSCAITGGTGAGRFAIDSATGRITLVNPSGLTAGASYTLQVQATDNGSPVLSGSGTVTVNVASATAINIDGIARQIWNNFNGNLDQFNSIPGYPYAPHETQIMTSFDAGAGTKPTYASRIRAYVVPPTTGAYQFHIASDNASRLLFSGSENPTGLTNIASVSDPVSRYNYTAQSTQKSAVKNLVAGQRYYVEVMHRQGPADEHLEVAWTGPDITTPTIIPGSALQPFDINVAPTWSGAPYSFTVTTDAANNAPVGTVSATDPEGGVKTYAILNGNSAGAFAINAATGAITVANAAALPPNQTVTLSVGVQDDGIGGIYPLKSAVANVSIKVDGPLEQWRQQKFGANAGNASIAGDAADPDRDGLPNLIEYALGLEPLQAGLGGLLTDTVTTGGQTYLRLTATKNPAATDVTFTIEATGDPATSASWSGGNTTIEVDTPTTLRARDKTPVGSATGRFLRLKVARP